MTEVAQAAAHVGRALERFEDAALLTGRGRYGDDVPVSPRTVHAAILRSSHAHAEILSIDGSAALANGALAVAADRYVAEDAVDRITVAYRELPAVVDAEAAARADAPMLHPAAGGN